MLIPEVDFSGVARALGAESAVIRSLADLSAFQEWIDAGARGTFGGDLRWCDLADRAVGSLLRAAAQNGY